MEELKKLIPAPFWRISMQNNAFYSVPATIFRFHGSDLTTNFLILQLCCSNLKDPMKSIREIYRIGTGPSSSHTMGPRKAAEIFLSSHKGAHGFEVVLYGSLAATGKGHMTDAAIIDVLSKSDMPVNIVWKPDTFLPYHPNAMTFRSLDEIGFPTDETTFYSVGGGAIEEEGKPRDGSPELYNLDSLTEIMQYCERTGRAYWEYVEQCEGPEIWDYLREVWHAMIAEIGRAHV